MAFKFPDSLKASITGDEVKGALGALFRTTLEQAKEQASTVKEALERGAKEGMAKLEEVRDERKRQLLLVELGEHALTQIQRGAWTLHGTPEIAALVAKLDSAGGKDATESAPHPADADADIVDER